MTQAPGDRTAQQFLFDKVGFKPLPEQEPILQCRKRFILVAGGWQAGKSLIASKYLLSRLPESHSPALYWLVAADYERTRMEFQYLDRDFRQLGLLQESSKRLDPGQIELLDGTLIKTKSSKDPRTLAMESLDGIIGCEASQLDLDTYMRLNARVGPKRGWLFLAGSFEGSLGWYPNLFEAWRNGDPDHQSFSLPSWTNIYAYPGGRNDPEILRFEKEQSLEFFQERFGGQPSKPSGLVFREFRSDIHVKACRYIPEEPVYLWIDPGYSEAYAIEVVQIQHDIINVIDEIYLRDVTTEELIGTVETRPWYNDVVGGAIDVGGLQHHATASAADVWQSMTGLTFHSERVRIGDGIERLKHFLKIDPTINEPRIVIAPHCHGILSEFGVHPNPFDQQSHAYRWKTDSEGNIIGDLPEDHWNHGIKAIIYGIVSLWGYGLAVGRNKIRVKYW